MMTIGDKITIAAGIPAVVLLIVLLIRSKAYYNKDNAEGRSFRLMVFSVLVMTCLAILIALGHHRVDFDSSIPELILMTAMEIVVCCNYLLWSVFVSMRLYKQEDYLARRFRFLVIPLFISIFCIIAYLGILWTFENYAEETLLAVRAGQVTPVAVLMIVLLFLLFLFHFMRFVYLVFSLILIRRYKKQNGYMKFFNVAPFFIALLIGILVTLNSSTNVLGLFIGIGLALLYHSIDAERRYMDPETKLYDKSYIEYLKGLVKKQKYAPFSAMIYTAEDKDDMTKLAEALRDQLPDNCESIRLSEKEVIVLTLTDDRALLSMVMEDVKEAAGGVNASCVHKDENETAEGFLERVAGYGSI